MAVPLKDGAIRPCGGVAPDFKCDQMAMYRTAPLKELEAGGVPQLPAPKYPGWCCPLGHFEAHEPVKV